MIRFSLTRTSGGPKPSDGDFRTQTTTYHWEDRPDEETTWNCIEFESLGAYLNWARNLDEDVILSQGTSTLPWLQRLDHFKGATGDPLPSGSWRSTTRGESEPEASGHS
jgi:hypothetical protein